MSTESKHLDAIMAKHNRIANLQIVFVDIVKYSKRRTQTQTEVIDRFTQCLGQTLTNTSKEFVQYAQTNSINFQSDIITLPTGDGAAVVFSFDGLHDIHLFFAKRLLEEIYEANMSTSCEKYNDQGWCNCHPNFGIRVGIAEGRGIVFKDINNNFNVAGGVINSAARVMSMADGNQIIFTKDAYQQVVDMVDDPNLVDRFIEFKNVRIKHGLEIDVYQYTGEGEPYISNAMPEDLSMMQRTEKAISTLSNLGFPMPMKALKDLDVSKVVNVMETMAHTMSELQKDISPKQTIDVSKEES